MKCTNQNNAKVKNEKPNQVALYRGQYLRVFVHAMTSGYQLVITCQNAYL